MKRLPSTLANWTYLLSIGFNEEPKAEKVQKFIDYASSFGLRIYGTASEISQEALQDIMRTVEGEPYADVLSMMLLRSMQQARYSETITATMD